MHKMKKRYRRKAFRRRRQQKGGALNPIAILKGAQAVGKLFNPSGRRRPAGYARDVLSGRLKKFKRDFIKKYGADQWYW